MAAADSQCVAGCRVIMSALGSRGDVNPVLGVAEQLRELGADVVVLLPGNRWYSKAPLRLRKTK